MDQAINDYDEDSFCTSYSIPDDTQLQNLNSVTFNQFLFYQKKKNTSWKYPAHIRIPQVKLLFLLNMWDTC